MEKELSKDMQEKLLQLQLMQQRLNLFANQKQTSQLQMAEVENALAELEHAKSPVYKIVGEILVERDAKELKKDLLDKKSDLDIRVKSIDKQENKTREKALELQKELTEALK